MVVEQGVTVAADFGSMAGEVALCTQAVGIADRSELVKLELSGAAAPLARAYEEVTGRDPVERLARLAERAWWCCLPGERVVCLSEPADEAAVRARAEGLASAEPEVALSDRSGELAAVGVVGPSAEALLRSAGLAPGAEIPPAGALREVHVDGLPALLLREATTHFLAMCPAQQAAHLWWTLHDAGAELGAGLVGREALDHVEVNERTLAGQAVD